MALPDATLQKNLLSDNKQYDKPSICLLLTSADAGYKKLPPRPSTDTAVNGYQLKLVSITPYPGTSTGPIQTVLRITR